MSRVVRAGTAQKPGDLSDLAAGLAGGLIVLEKTAFNTVSQDAIARVLPRPGALPERRLRGHAFALLWAAGTVLVIASLVAPGGEGPEPEAWTVGAVSLTFARALFAGAGRFPRWSFDVAVAAGSGLVSALVWESGGAASTFVPLYLWELAFAAAFLPPLAHGTAVPGRRRRLRGGHSAAGSSITAGRLLIAVATMLVVPWLVAAVRGHVVRLVADLDRQATTDALSELANRRAFTNAIDLEHARAARRGRPISIVVLDLDHFKTVNDRFGHPAGDRALRHVAGILRSGCRAADVAARIGGEEFALLLPETDGPAALLIAERVRAVIASSTTPDGIRITASFGVTESDGSDPLVAADRALYRAKAAGRDRCVLADSEPT